MATRIYAINPGGTLDDVIEDVGPTGTSGIVAVVVDLASTGVTDGATTRAIRRNETLQALEYIKQYIIADQDPPA